MTAWLPFAVVAVLVWGALLALHRPVIRVPPWPA